MLRADEVNRIRWLSIAPFGVLLAIGIYPLGARSAAGDSAEFLITSMGLTVILATVRYFRIDPGTIAGNAMVEASRQRHSSRNRAVLRDEMAIAVG